MYIMSDSSGVLVRSESSDRDLDNIENNIESIILNSALFRNNISVIRDYSNNIISRLNDISINTFMLSVPPINFILNKNSTSLIERSSPKKKSIECICCYDTNVTMSIRSYRTCKATPKHNVCKRCFQLSNKSDCFYCFPQGKNRRPPRATQIIDERDFFYNQEMRHIRRNRELRRNQQTIISDSLENANRFLCITLSGFVFLWIILSLIALL